MPRRTRDTRPRPRFLPAGLAASETGAAIVLGVAAFDPHAGLVGGDDAGRAQGDDCRIAPGDEGPLSPAQHVHQAALTDGETEDTRKRALQAFVGQGLEGSEVRRYRMHARPEQRPFRRIRHGRDNPRSKGQAVYRQTSMALDRRLDLGKIDPVVRADRLGAKIARQAGQAARALVGAMIDEFIECFAH